jgi:uncharacterized delta-60 repeat protein
MEKIKLLLALVVLALITSLPCYADEWAITYGGSGRDSARSIQETSDGGYVVAGYTDSFGAGNYDFWVLKVTPNGSIAWQKTYGGSDWDSARSIQETSHGGYVVAGDSGSVNGNAWILKLNSDGTLDGPSAWQKNYGPGLVRSVQQTTDGGYIAADDGRVLKLNSDGSVDWQKTYHGSDGIFENTIRQTFDEWEDPDGYIMAGTTTSFGADRENFWVLRLDLDGNIVWQKTYGDDDANLAKSIQQTQDGGYVVTGWTGSFVQGEGWQVWVLKLYPDGQPNPGDYGMIQWQKTYTRFVGNWDWVEHIQQTSDGGYVMTGATWSGEYALFVLKIDLDGNFEWNKRYFGSAEDEWGYSIGEISDGGYIVAGNTESFGAGGSDFWILKLDENGEIPGCNRMSSSSMIVSDTSVEGQNTSVTPQDFSAEPNDTDVIPQDTIAETSVVCSWPAADPVIDKLRRKRREPGQTFNILGSNFGAGNPSAYVRIGSRELPYDHNRIIEWTPTKIKVKIPKKRYVKNGCAWFKGFDERKVKVWVNVGGTDSNKKRLTLLKPLDCY